MGTIKLSIDIDASPEAVFDVVADIENSAERLEDVRKIEMLTEGPVDVGTKWRETRFVMKKESIEEMEITEFARPTHYSVYCDSCGYDVEWTMRVDPRGDNSTLTLDMTSKPRTFVGKLMSPIEWLMAGMMKKCVLKDFEELKTFVETQQAASGDS